MPPARRTTHTFWAVVHNPAGKGNATLTRSSDTGAITATEGGGAVDVIFPINVSDCADVAGRNNDGTSVPDAGYARSHQHRRVARRRRSSSRSTALAVAEAARS